MASVKVPGEIMLRARDIMTRELIVVAPDTEVAHAAELLLENHINGVPVKDRAGKLVGILCQSDLIAQQKTLPIPSIFTSMDGLIRITSMKQIEKQSGGLSGKLTGKPGTTVLDQLHQTMLLFGAGRGEALKRFLVEEGVGNNPMYWRLAQSLSALYPSGTDEKRWVDGVLARKKSIGF